VLVHVRQNRRAVVWLPVVQRHCALDHVGATVRAREVSDVQVDVSEESVVTLVRVFSVVHHAWSSSVLTVLFKGPTPFLQHAIRSIKAGGMRLRL
jgi:hypothetical protein